MDLEVGKWAGQIYTEGNRPNFSVLAACSGSNVEGRLEARKLVGRLFR